MVYFGGSDMPGVSGRVAALTDGGAPSWDTPLEGTPVSISSSITGAELYVVATTNGSYYDSTTHTEVVPGTRIYDLDATTGLVNWASYLSPSEAPIGHNAIVLNPGIGAPAAYLYYVAGGNLLQLDPADGHILHSTNVGSGHFSSMNLFAPPVGDGIVYVASGMGGSISAFDAVTLAPLWTFNASGATLNSPALAIPPAGAPALYFVSTRGNVYSVNAINGIENWDLNINPTGPPLGSATVIDGDDDIILDIPNDGVVNITDGGGAPAGPTDGGVTTYAGPSHVTVSVGSVLVAGAPAVVVASVTSDYTTTDDPTGSVDFFANGVWIGNAPIDGSGDATLDTTDLPAGSDDITATYSGDPNFDSATDSITATVDSANNTTDLTYSVSSSPLTFSDSATLTATIDPTTSGGATPTGTVTFFDAGTAIASATLGGGGVASASLNNLPAGDNAITATYSGDTNYTGSTSSEMDVAVAQATPTVTVTDASGPYTGSTFDATALVAGTLTGVDDTLVSAHPDLLRRHRHFGNRAFGFAERPRHLHRGRNFRWQP